MEFRWNADNIDHIDRHGISPAEAQYVVEHARPPFPEKVGDGKHYVAGQTREGYYIQVAYVLDPDDTAYIIHARPLIGSEKRWYRRRIR